MPLYQYILENESERYYFYFSYDIDSKKAKKLLMESIERSTGQTAEIFDTFPEPKVQKGTTTEPLKIITKIGKEMYLPPNFKIEIIGKYRILFQYTDE